MGNSDRFDSRIGELTSKEVQKVLIAFHDIEYFIEQNPLNEASCALQKKNHLCYLVSMSGLILETSTEKGLIALSIDGAPIAAKTLTGGPGLSKTLALEVKNLLTLHSFQPSYIAVGTGPGSYTGIRVGAALAKSLSFGWSIPLFGFCSLKAFSTPESCAVLVDARMGGFYALIDGQPCLLSSAQAESTLLNISLFASPHPDLIRKRLPQFGPCLETFPTPHSLSALAHALFLKDERTPLVLSYLTAP